jgi:hypothetical protein
MCVSSRLTVVAVAVAAVATIAAMATIAAVTTIAAMATVTTMATVAAAEQATEQTAAVAAVASTTAEPAAAAMTAVAATTEQTAAAVTAEAAMATIAAVATAGDGRRVGAQQSDTHQSDKDRDSEDQSTIHPRILQQQVFLGNVSAFGRRRMRLPPKATAHSSRGNGTGAIDPC